MIGANNEELAAVLSKTEIMVLNFHQSSDLSHNGWVKLS